MSALALVCALALGQLSPDGLDGGSVPAPDAPREAIAVTAVSYTLADGGIVTVASTDGGVAAVILTPEKAIALSNERQQKDWELAAARSEALRPQQISTVAIVVGVIKTLLDAVPVVVSVVQAARQP